MNILQALAPIRTATLAARQRTGEQKINTEVQAGKIRVVVDVKEGRRIVPVPVFDWTDPAQVPAQLDSLKSFDDLTTQMARAAFMRSPMVKAAA